ncbi:ABC transporter six-transmembrane domain-containing protein [Ectopseudomonas khazarica]|uniref:ABC transporter six-transmembrane domain-containing protein n=1 Tax=Ectopseudomonas khazarica TaxID=2502979 RepID=UPI0040336CAE
MSALQTISLAKIVVGHKHKISVTWILVIAENLLMALLPLFIGYSIDSLMNNQYQNVLILAGVLTALVIVAVARRIYDTRIYGDIRVKVGLDTDTRLRSHPVSTRSARLSMSREPVDFLEHDLPPLLTAIIQLLVTLIVLASFSPWLAMSAGGAGLLMLTIYALFHQSFVRLNARLNSQVERQVNVLSSLPPSGLYTHLRKLKAREVKLSDTEAALYGIVFMVLFAFVLTNLLLTTQLNTPSAGQLFAVVTYSLEFVEAALLLPITLQTLSRLRDIHGRLNAA